ncbi:hypothetical protein [Rhizobium sp. GN54]|uniref:hypothetical protein n=1 Tax=Rhizobium sp. GN54 TaxID=2898150 RepID=UPI001E352A7C|nr:hypothetical protein [Rhizobium sp. GN54]MCD2181607.1 hypothetical protein [Rhizobium sp. GN54]
MNGPGIIDTLVALAHCPVCGAARSSLTYHRPQVIGEALFSCGAAFAVANAEIIPSTLCPAPSHVAARVLNASTGAEE